MQNSVSSAVERAGGFLGGVYFDRNRESATPCRPELIAAFLKVSASLAALLKVSASLAAFLTVSAPFAAFLKVLTPLHALGPSHPTCCTTPGVPLSFWS